MNRKTWLKGLGIALLLILSAAGFAEPADGTVRVLLSRLGVQDSLSFRANCGYTLNAVEIPADTNVTARLENGALRVSFGETTLDCGAEANFLRGEGGACGIRFSTQRVSDLYCGDLRLTVRENAILPVLSLDVEDYLRGLLGDSDTEPMEAIKAQVIAARSSALRHKETEAAQPYDFADDADGYVFEGYASAHARVLQAVDATRGKTLFAGDLPALCPSTESNGGQTECARGEEASDGIVKDDPYDLESRTAETRTAVIRRDAANLDARLRQYLIDGMADQLKEWGLNPEDVSILRIASVEPVDPADPAPSRVYRALRMEMEIRSTNPSTGKPVDCTAALEVPTFGGFEDWYALSINPEDNETVAVTETAEAFEIAFRRDGSGVGLSRCGASVMAAGYDMDCAAILEFYFPGTELRALELAAENPEPAADARTQSPYALPTIAPAATEIAPTEAPSSEDASSTEDATSPAGEEGVLLKFLTPEPMAVSDADAENSRHEIPLDEELDDFDDMPLDEEFEDFDDDMLLDEELDGFDDDMPLDEEFDDFDDDMPLDEEFEDFDDDMPLDEELEDFDDMPLDEELDGFDDEIPLDDEAETADADAEMTAPAEETHRFVNVKESGSLTLRSKPSEHGEKLGKLRRGESVRVLEWNADWARVETEDGREGYASMAYLTEDAPKGSADNAWTRFQASHPGAKRCDKTARARVNVRMRAEASTEAEILCKVAGGKKVAVRGYDDTWAYVTYKNKTGFIMKKYLKFGA